MATSSTALKAAALFVMALLLIATAAIFLRGVGGAPLTVTAVTVFDCAPGSIA